MNLKWSYSSSKGFYIGFKVTVVIDYDSMKPVAILIHSRAPNDSKLSMKYWKIFKKDKIYKKDVIFFDKG